jgi:hypothetical protein
MSVSEHDPDEADRERRIAAIVDGAKRARPRASRTLWWVAGVIGAICVVAFVAMMLVDAGAETGSPAKPPGRETGAGFATGLAVGLGVGIAIGFAIARHRADHSSRKSP